MVRGYTRAWKNSAVRRTRKDSAVRRRAAVAAIGAIGALCAVGVAASPALAAPEWGIEMTHANAYGQQVGECPGGIAKYVPGKPEEDCGVNPFTGSGTTFARESGFNTYVITVRNAGRGGSEVLTCHPGTWTEEPALEYRWLRDEQAIAGATEATYTPTAADEGTAVQCEIVASNGGGVALATSPAAAIPPAGATAAPVKGEGNPYMLVEEEREPETGARARDLAENPSADPGRRRRARTPGAAHLGQRVAVSAQQ